MPFWIQIFTAGAVLAALLAALVLKSPRPLASKLAALALFTALLLLLWGGLGELLGRPKPIALEWWRARTGEATVLSAQIHEDRGIYLWLQLAGVEEPRAYVLPWDRRLAELLQAALREAEENGTGVIARLPFEPSLDDRDPPFYALPQPALPPKDLLMPPQEFVPPDTAT